VRGWLVRKRRNLSFAPVNNGKLHREGKGESSRRRFNSNGNNEEHLSIQELMIFIIDKLVNGTTDEYLNLISKPFVNPKVLQMRIKYGPLIMESYDPNLY
jgi:hypothetical protein